MISRSRTRAFNEVEMNLAMAGGHPTDFPREQRDVAQECKTVDILSMFRVPLNLKDLPRGEKVGLRRTVLSKQKSQRPGCWLA